MLQQIHFSGRERLTEIDQKRAEALKAELTEEFTRIAKETMSRFGLSGHYRIAFDIQLVVEEKEAQGEAGPD